MRPGTLRGAALLPLLFRFRFGAERFFVASGLLPSQTPGPEGNALRAEVWGDAGQAGDP